VVSVLKQAPTHEDVWFNSTLLNLSTRWRWVVSYKPRPIYNLRTNFQYQLDGALDETWSWSWHCSEKISLWSHTRSNSDSPTIQPVA
jgi:hypothetical protein